MTDHVRDELGLLLTGALDEADAERVFAHLDTCDACAGELARLQALEESLGRLGRRRRWPLAAALAAAACLAALLLWPRPVEPATRTSPLRLAGGSTVEALPTARLDVETPRRIRLISGKALFNVVPGPDPFVVETVRGSATAVGTSFTVEVSDMNARIPTAAAVVTVAVVSGVVVWRGTDGEARIQAGEQGTIRAGAIELKAAPPTPPTSSDKVASLEKENSALRTQLEQISRKSAELEAKLAALAAPAAVASETAATGTTPAPDPKKADPAKARIAFGAPDRLAKLGKIDWKEAAEAAAATGRLIKELMAKAAAGEPIPPELAQQVNTENAKLIKLALAAAQAFPTHGGANGGYTHPIVLANLMSNQLDLAGLSLDDSQAQSIVQLGNDYDSAYEAAQNGYTDQTLALQKLLDEAALKKSFMQGVDGVLNAQQQAALFDPASKDVYMVDLYSPGLMFAQFLQPIAKTTPESLVKSVAKTWTEAWDLGNTDPTAAAQSFVSGLSLQPVPAAAVGQFKLDDALAAGRGTLKVMKDLLATLPPDGEAAASIKQATGFVIPRLLAK